MFGKILDRLGFFRREALLVTKIMKNLAGIAGSSTTLCRRTMRLMASSHPSGVVRIQEMRDILLLAIGSVAAAAFAYDKRGCSRGKPFSLGDWAGLEVAAGGESCDKSERAEITAMQPGAELLSIGCSELRRSSRGHCDPFRSDDFGGSDGVALSYSGTTCAKTYQMKS